MRNQNECVICGELYRGKKGLPCQTCVKTINEHHKAVREGAATSAIVNVQDRWLYLGGRGKASDELEKIVLKIFNGFPKVPWNAEGYAEIEPTLPVPRGFYDGGKACRAVPLPQAEAVANLAIAIRAAVQEAHTNGVAEGRNLLAQLAAGELTTTDFERRAGLTKEDAE